MAPSGVHASTPRGSLDSPLSSSLSDWSVPCDRGSEKALLTGMLTSVVCEL